MKKLNKNSVETYNVIEDFVSWITGTCACMCLRWKPADGQARSSSRA